MFHELGLYRVDRCVTIRNVISLHVALRQISVLTPLTARAYINGIGLGSIQTGVFYIRVHISNDAIISASEVK